MILAGILTNFATLYSEQRGKRLTIIWLYLKSTSCHILPACSLPPFCATLLQYGSASFSSGIPLPAQQADAFYFLSCQTAPSPHPHSHQFVLLTGKLFVNVVVVGLVEKASRSQLAS